MTKKIAFIGLGAMGGPMAANIQRKGTVLTVFDIDSARMAPLVALGATAAGSLAEAVNGAQIVITMLPATAHVEEAILGGGGVLDLVVPGTIILDMSTIAPTGTDRIAAACEARRVIFIDAPVGRLAIHAQRGESLFMVGTENDQAFEAVRPLLEGMGTTIHRCGAVGTGIRTKLINNLVVITVAQVMAEALTLAAKLGVDIDLFKEVNAGTSGTNGQFHMNYATKSLIGDLTPGFTVDLAHKDLTLAIEAANSVRVGLPAGAAAHAMLGLARSGPHANHDFTAMLDFSAELAGIKPPRLRNSPAV